MTVVVATRVPDPNLDFSMVSATPVEVEIGSYVAVPQGQVLLETAAPAAARSIRLTNGLVAGKVRAGTSLPQVVDIDFHNPVAQRTVRVVSTSIGTHRAVSDAVVQATRRARVRSTRGHAVSRSPARSCEA